MTRSIHADLLTDQKKLAYVPSLQAIFQDNDLPHPDEQLAHPMTGYSGNPTASVATANEIVRAQRVSGVGINIQRITDPTVSSQWTTGWTTVCSGADYNYPALFYTGTYIVLVYQNTSSKDFLYRRSSDGGASWGSETTIATGITYLLNNKQIGCSAGATRSGFFCANGVSIYFWKHNATANTWGLECTGTEDGTVKSIGAVNPDSDENYQLAVILEDYASWTDSALVLQTYKGLTGTPAAFQTTPVVYAGLQGGTGASPAYYYTHVNLALVGTDYWMSFYLATDTDEGALFADGDQLLAFSNDGVYFTGGVKLDQKNIADRLQPLPWGDDTYIASDTVMLKSTPPSSVTVPTADIIDYEITDKAGPAWLEMTLDNRDGTYDSLHTNRLGCDLAFERGTVINGTARRVARETFIVDRITREKDGNSVEVHAYNYFRLLTLWHADLTYYFAGDTVQVLVERIAALCGIHTVSFDGSSFWSNAITAFTITPGQSAADALGSLAEQFQFVTRISSGRTLECLALSASPSSDYTFGTGSGEHPTFFVQDEADRRLPTITHAQVIGTGAAAEDIDIDLQAESGRQFTHRITRSYITSAADAAAAATAIMTKATAGVERSTLVAMPAFHLQPFDVVTSDDFSADTVRYVAAIREVYNPHRAEKYPTRKKRPTWWQTLILSELTDDAAGMSGINLVDAASHNTALVRGTLISFDSATWKALVRLDESHSAIPMYVGEWVSPANLDAGRRVAVLLFDAANPDDGLVIGTFGTVRWRQFDRLYANDGDPGPALSVDANGNVGIGTESPQEHLHVLGAGPQRVEFESTNAAATVFKLTNTEGSFALICDADQLRFYDYIDSAIRMALDGTGKLGIGTTSPQEKIHVSGAGVQRIEVEATDANGAVVKLTNTEGSYAFYVDNDEFRLYDYIDAAIRFVLDGDGNVGIGNTNPGHRLDVLTDAASAYAARIHNDGNATTRYGLQIWCGVDTPGAANNYALAIKDGDGTTVGSITFNSGGTSYNTSSDRKIKRNIQPTKLGLAELSRLQVREFENKDDPGNRHNGFVAQELLEVLPEAVSQAPDGEDLLLIDQSRVVPLLASALQELTAKVDDLTQQLETSPRSKG